jgi:hypothetical protein
MKKLLFILLFTPLLTFGQWVNNYKMLTSHVYENGKYEFCATGFFQGNRNEGEIIFKVFSMNDTLINNYVSFLGTKGNFECPIIGKSKSGFYKVIIKHYELAKVKSLPFITSIVIWVKNGNKPPLKRVLIVGKDVKHELPQLITYTKPL